MQALPCPWLRLVFSVVRGDEDLAGDTRWKEALRRHRGEGTLSFLKR